MMNELKILNRLLPALAQTPDVATGPGDDCAVLKTSGELLLLAAVKKRKSPFRLPLQIIGIRLY